MKRMLCLLLCLLLFAPSAMAQDGSFAAYQLPQGGQVSYLAQAHELEVPQGLESMYDLMQHATLQGDIYLMRMPNGRALASIGCSPVPQERTAEELLGFWPQIALALGREAAWVNDDPSCAAVQNLYGFDVLHIQTQLLLQGESSLMVDAEGLAFCKDGSMIEVWAVQPADPIYLFDEQAARELAHDREALAQFMNSLDFSGTVPALETESYADPDGRFALQVLAGSTIITARTPMEQVSAAREQFLSANEPGAEKMFDEMMEDVYAQRVTLILSPDHKGAIEVFCSQEEDFAGATPEILCMLAEPIRQSLATRYGIAVTLNADSRAVLSQQEHAHLCYWLRPDKFNVQLDVLSCVIGENWLCEVDLYTVDGDQAVRTILHSLVAQTLRYTVE